MDEEYVSLKVYEEHNRRMEDEHQRTNHRLAELERSHAENHKLLIAVEKLALSMERMQQEQEEQGERLDKLEDRDGEQWRKAGSRVIDVALGILVGYIFKLIGIF
jgi:hypothetical protein